MPSANSEHGLMNALRSLEGLPIIEWRAGYGESGSFHLGRRIPEKASPPGRSARDRGTVILTIWEAGVTVSYDATHGERNTHPPTSLKSLGLERFVGETISSVEWSRTSERLRLLLSSGSLVDVEPDTSASADADQWVLETDATGTYIVRRGPVVVTE